MASPQFTAMVSGGAPSMAIRDRINSVWLRRLAFTVAVVLWMGLIYYLSSLSHREVAELQHLPSEASPRANLLRQVAGRLFLSDIPQIEPPFLDIAPAGMLPTIISHSKGVKCVLIRSNSSFHGPTTVLPSVKSPNRLSTTKSLPWEALLPCTTR